MKNTTVILQIFGVVLFSVYLVVNGFTEIKKTPKWEKYVEWSRQHPRTPKLKRHRTLGVRSPPKICKLQYSKLRFRRAFDLSAARQKSRERSTPDLRISNLLSFIWMRKIIFWSEGRDCKDILTRQHFTTKKILRTLVHKSCSGKNVSDNSIARK